MQHTYRQQVFATLNKCLIHTVNECLIHTLSKCLIHTLSKCLIHTVNECLQIFDNSYFVNGLSSRVKGAKSCHTGVQKSSGWIIPVGALLNSGVMPRVSNDQYASVAAFFSASCAPGSYAHTICIVSEQGRADFVTIAKLTH